MRNSLKGMIEMASLWFGRDGNARASILTSYQSAFQDPSPGALPTAVALTESVPCFFCACKPLLNK